MATTIIKITTNDANATMSDRLSADASRPRQFVNQLINYLGGCAAGSYAMSMDVQVNGGTLAPATGTFTGTSVVATNTVTINGVTFTAVASGATGNQFNIGGTDTITMANLAAAVNGSVSALISGYVTATSASNVATVTAAHNGVLGNLVTIASGQGTIVASGATLTGGTEATANVYHFGL